jgi:hypothetical protein
MMVMLGGAWVRTFIFPAWLQQFTRVVPVRWAVDGLDAMTRRGIGSAGARHADARAARICRRIRGAGGDAVQTEPLPDMGRRLVGTRAQDKLANAGSRL